MIKPDVPIIIASKRLTRLNKSLKEIVAIKTEMDIQFKDLFNRVKRLEAIVIGASAFIIALLLRINMMG